MRNIKQRASTLEKTIHRHREDFHQTISDIFEKRLSLKEVKRSEEASVEGRPSVEIAPLTKEMIVSGTKLPTFEFLV